MKRKTNLEDDDSLVNEVAKTRSQTPVIYIELEDGTERPYLLAHVMRVRGREYAILLPKNEIDLSDEGSALIFRIETDSKGYHSLVEINSEKEFERVASAWDELLDEIADQLEEE
jgi:putative Holliday junction resolvase